MITKKQKKETILELLIERNEYKTLSDKYKKALKTIASRFYNIGAPLNDNVLNFNNKQLHYLINIKDYIEGIFWEEENE